jgi:hypothetical protein
MIELFVENSIVDINVGFATLLTMAIDDIKDFGAKNTTFSKSIILPGTKRNNTLFGNIFDVSGSNDYNPSNTNKGINFNAATSAKAYIFADNIQIFKGTFRILEVIIDDGKVEYEAVVFGELGGFVSKLGTAKLEDLDFSTYNHTYTLANIASSWSNYAGGSGYYYPLIDYGNYSANKKDYNVGTFRPALFIKEYISKIFAATGYTYTSELFTGSGVDALRFRRLIIPHNRKTLQKKSALQLDVNITPIYNLALNGDGSNDTNINLNTQTLIGGFTPSVSNTKFTYSGATQTGTINLDLDVDFNTGISYQAGGISVKKNGTGILGAGLYSGVYPSGGNYTNLLSISGITIVSGDYLEVFFSNSGDVGDYADVTINKSRLTFGNTGNNYVDVSINDPLVINDTIPQNILQKDFISSIVKLFNLYIFEDNTKEKNLQIMPFVDFYADADSEDYSLKVDRSQPLRIKPMSELNSRYYEFKFKDDADYYNDLYKKRYNESYGTYKYDSGFEFSKDSTTIELIFSGTPLLGYTSEDKVVSTIFKRTGTTTGSGEESIDSNIRILQAKLISGVASWDIKNAAGISTLGSYTNYPYAGHFDDPDAPTNDIQFGVPKELFYELLSGSINVNQFNLYWSSYMAEITDKDSKLLTATVKLKFSDIYNLDFSKLKWVDGSLFRLNKVIDFNATQEDTCKVELLKIINRIY